MKWEENYPSLCEAPLKPISIELLDDDHPVMAFTRYWQDLNGGRMPDRSAFRPEAVPAILRWLMILQRVMTSAQDDYVVRLQGTSATRLAHLNFTGKRLQDFTSGGCFSSRLEALRATIKRGQPGYARAIPGEGGEYSVEVFIGAFPFTCGDGGAQVFLVAAPSEPDLWDLI